MQVDTKPPTADHIRLAGNGSGCAIIFPVRGSTVDMNRYAHAKIAAPPGSSSALSAIRIMVDLRLSAFVSSLRIAPITVSRLCGCACDPAGIRLGPCDAVAPRLPGNPPETPPATPPEALVPDPGRGCEPPDLRV